MGICNVAILTFEGRVENGAIRLPADVSLPDHTKVYVVIPNSDIGRQARVLSPRLRNTAQAADFVKEIVEVRPDAEL
jgi:virulence-associated protein VagC